MPKPRKFELIRCAHFVWRLTPRDGVFYADGRSNKLDAGRHSLNTRDKQEALKLLFQLDIQRAAELGLISHPKTPEKKGEPLTLAAGRKLYEDHIGRSQVTGGVRRSAQARYRTVFDKFIPFAESIGMATWNAVDKTVLHKYATHLERTGYTTPKGKKKDYLHKTLHNELTTLKQAVKWLIDEGHLTGRDKIRMPLRKAQSERHYCWTVKEVAAMIEYCRTHTLQWLADLIVALACTGLRISELASLRWSDVNFTIDQIMLTDETAHGQKDGISRRQTKSGRSRSFPIHPDLQDVLKSRPRRGLYIFHGPRGGRLKPDTARNVLIRDVLEPLAAKFPSPVGTKGFKDGRLHSFRHFFASRCANSGKPEQMVMQWLGHANSGMVRHYYHLDNDEARQHMNSLDLLGDAGKRSTGDVQPTASSNSEDQPGRDSSASNAT